MPEPVEVVPTPEDVAIARAALLEITTDDTIGEPAGFLTEADDVLTLYFENTMRGYVGWKWTVSIAHAAGTGPSVLETELMPAEGALLSPDWVPWSERLADYKETQAELAADALHDDSDGDESDDDDDDDDDFDDDDVNDDDEALLHSGDFDGVDIDSLDDSHESHESHESHDADASDDSDEANESALSAVSVDEPKKAKGKSDSTRPEPPVKPRRNQRAKKQQHSDEGE